MIFFLFFLMITGCMQEDTTLLVEEHHEEQDEAYPLGEQTDDDQTIQTFVPSIINTLNDFVGEHQSEKEKMTTQTEEGDMTRQNILEEMTLEQKLAQMLYVGVDGTSLSSLDQTLIADKDVGGIILLKNNVEDEMQLLQFIQDIKAANGDNMLPLFIGVDEEGGRVSRIPEEIFPNLPSNALIGTLNDAELSHTIGALLAKKVQYFGFNMNFAPVLDVNNNPLNPVIGDRSYSATADVVTTLGVATMKGMKEQHIIPVIKHFPGHGDTVVDSHYDLPVIHKTLAQLEALELIPFRAAIAEQADVVMVAHILYPLLDEQYPATLSSNIMHDLLREQLQFDGVIMTDDMTMGAIVEHYGLAEAVLLSMQAGADMVMVANHQTEHMEHIMSMLTQAVEEGTLSIESIDGSVLRIIKLKEQYIQDSADDSQLAPLQADQITEEIEHILQRMKQK